MREMEQTGTPIDGVLGPHFRMRALQCRTSQRSLHRSSNGIVGCLGQGDVTRHGMKSLNAQFDPDRCPNIVFAHQVFRDPHALSGEDFAKSLAIKPWMQICFKRGFPAHEFRLRMHHDFTVIGAMGSVQQPCAVGAPEVFLQKSSIRGGQIRVRRLRGTELSAHWAFRDLLLFLPGDGLVRYRWNTTVR